MAQDHLGTRRLGDGPNRRDLARGCLLRDIVIPSLAMARTGEDIEGYLNKLDRRFERLDDVTYLVAMAPRQPALAIRLAPPVVVVQVEMGRVAIDELGAQARLFRRLLEFNSHDLMHAAYGLNGDTIALTAALELDSLDLNELEAVLADMSLALAEHVPELKKIIEQQPS